MEEIRNEESMNTEETTNLVPTNDYVPEMEDNEGGVAPLIIGGLTLTAIAAGIGFGWKKLKGKREQKLLEKLKADGYTIIPPGEGECAPLDAEIVEEEESAKSK